MSDDFCLIYKTFYIRGFSLYILAVTLAFYPEHYTRRPTSVMMIYLLGAIIVILYAAIGSYLSLQYHRQSAEQNREIQQDDKQIDEQAHQNI